MANRPNPIDKLFQAANALATAKGLSPAWQICAHEVNKVLEHFDKFHSDKNVHFVAVSNFETTELQTSASYLQSSEAEGAMGPRPMPNQTNEFKVDDIVRLKSGSPTMQIIARLGHETQHTFKVTYWANGIQEQDIHGTCLVHDTAQYNDPEPLFTRDGMFAAIDHWKGLDSTGKEDKALADDLLDLISSHDSGDIGLNPRRAKQLVALLASQGRNLIDLHDDSPDFVRFYAELCSICLPLVEAYLPDGQDPESFLLLPSSSIAEGDSPQ